MKNNCIILILLLVIFQSCTTSKESFAQKEILNSEVVSSNDNANSFTFQVCDVKQAKELLPSKPYREVILEKTVNRMNLEAKYRAYNEMTPEERAKSAEPKGVPIRLFESSGKKDIQLVESHFHPLIGALDKAYAKHYPVTISPDMIWLLIAQGFATHVNNNGEEMRSYFVDFEGKKDLQVIREGFVKGNENNDWEGVFEEFSAQIEANTGADLLELITGDFSTTGAAERAAFQVTLMDAMKSYFSYSMISCGIPEITLEGTVEDWEKIEVKAQELAQYDLEWWINELMPILKEFTAAAEGKPNQEFWESIYMWVNPGCGDPTVTGWILKFFPYTKANKAVQFASEKEQQEMDEQKAKGMVVTRHYFPGGLSKADMVWKYRPGVFYKMELMAGFVGFHQDAETLSLRPEISWAVVDTGEKPTAEEIDALENGGDEKYLESIKKQ